MSNNDFSGKTVLVTGGTRGIGRAVSLRLASEGANVAANYYSRKADAEATLADIESVGGKAIIIEGDVSQPDDAAKIVAAGRDVAGVGQDVAQLHSRRACQAVEVGNLDVADARLEPSLVPSSVSRALYEGGQEAAGRRVEFDGHCGSPPGGTPASGGSSSSGAAIGGPMCGRMLRAWSPSRSKRTERTPRRSDV